MSRDDTFYLCCTTTVDPENSGAYIGDPQSWNGYEYARNNALIYIDPLGTDYRVYNEQGEEVAIYTDERFLDGLSPDVIDSISDDSRLITFTNGWRAEFFDPIDPITNPAFDIQANVGFFEFSGKDLRLADRLAREMDDAGMVPDHSQGVFSQLLNGTRRIHYSEIPFPTPPPDRCLIIGVCGAAIGGALAGPRFPILGLGSTGRTTPRNVLEQIAMEQARSNPTAGDPIPLRGGMNDPRWPNSEGWVKMRQNVNGVEIHYVYNTKTGEMDDFKFK